MPLEVQKKKQIKSIFVECGKTKDAPPIRVSCEQSAADDTVLDRHGVRISVRACGLISQNFSSLQDLYKKIQTNRSFSLLTNNYSPQQHDGPVELSVGQDVAGVVIAIGSEVSSVNIGDEVVGIIPLDSNQSGCSESVVFQEFDVVKKPKKVSFVDAAGCIGDAVKAYTALHYLGHMSSGSTVLVLNGASSFGSLCVQLAHHWGAKVLSTASSRDEALYLKSLGPSIVQVLEAEEGSTLRAAVMHESGGLGVDVLLEPDCPLPPYSKHDLISCLAIGGCWITSRSNLQLDPPNSRQLYMRCASVSFLFEQAWLMSSVQQGKYQHVLLDIMEKISSDVIRPNIHHTVSFDEVAEAVLLLEEVKVGKVVMMA